MYPIYNTQLVQAKDLPETWADLLDPRWRGKIATSPITIGGTAWVQYDFMATQLGADYLKQFAAQMPKLFPSYDPAVLSVARGETVLGIVSALNEYSARTHQGAPIMPLYLPEGTPYTDYPMMLTANAPHPNAGELFANWYLSKTAQTQLVNVRGAYSVRDDVAPAQGNPALADTKPWNPGDAAIVRDHDALVKKVSEMLGR
jgi:iron(III) transport system substrate-binding protein